MNRQVIFPDNNEHWLRLKAEDITSTEIAALFGCSPYCTPFELWHRKRNKWILRLEENERMKWGKRFEDAIAQGVATDNGWFHVKKKSEYIRLPELRLAASFDYEVCVEQPSGAWRDVTLEPGSLPWEILEIKNVDYFVFKDEWLKKGKHVEAPLHIEFQVQHQLLVSGMKKSKFVAMVGGNNAVLIERDADEAVHGAILAKSAEFWASVEEGREPSPDFVKDADFIMTLFKRTARGKNLNFTEDPQVTGLVQRYVELRDQGAEADRLKKAIAAEIVTHMGDAEKAFVTGFSISAPPNKAGDSRNFRID